MTYSINTSNFINNLLPPQKRTIVQEAWLNALNHAADWLNRNFNEYIYGVTYSYYTASATYSMGNRVIGGLANNNYIYESITNSNIGNTLSNINYWEYVNNNFIGVNERDLYFDQKMTMEWALNRWYNTRFVQNTGVTSSATHSDIYITDNTVLSTTFLVSPSDFLSSKVYPSGSSAFVSPSASITSGAATTGWYTIHVPVAVYNAIPGGSQSVVNFTNKYNYASIPFGVVSY